MSILKQDAIHPSWLDVIGSEFEERYFSQIINTIKTDIAAGKVIYPKGSHIFHAFNLTPFHEVRVVILGQDPYHGEGQAHGLAFSVPQGVAIPPSLQNIFTEINRDLQTKHVFTSGNLEAWARQGILLLNTSLTVIKAAPMSHANIGWNIFTERVIQKISTLRKHVVFLLWGSFAISKQQHIDHTQHMILTAPHPSPLSAHRGFIGCRHFSTTNTYLRTHHQPPIAWLL